ncbi:MAG: hypothetical protein Kow0092_10810 [Deferrisomatales bacterium]
MSGCPGTPAEGGGGRLARWPPLSPQHREILKLALPYLGTRHNEEHTRVSLGFCRELLRREEGREAIAVPAILLHDVGWSRVPEERQLTAFGPRVQDPELRRVHEREGARIARGILDAVGYPAAASEEVVHIVDGHDTRLEALSPSDALVKDADKLFRLSRPGFAIDCERFGLDPGAHLDWLEARVGEWFFTRTARGLARREIGCRRRERKGG